MKSIKILKFIQPRNPNLFSKVAVLYFYSFTEHHPFLSSKHFLVQR